MQKQTNSFASLLSLIDASQALVGVVGLGYVGLPLALAAHDAGYRTVGFDINKARVEAINNAEQVISYIGSDVMTAALATGRLGATDDFSRLAEPDIIFICVPTPINRNREPDLSYVETTARSIAATLRPGQLVVLESTSWPGTTAEVLQPILEATGLIGGIDTFVAFSPEREDPGNGGFNTRTIPKVVGADDPQSLEAALAIYRRIVERVVPVSSTRAAEATKLTENIFRSVNIALVNELKVVYDAMGIDVWEVIEAASTKPFGFLPFYPGPGLGGHCIPIDPFYLTWKAREFGMETRFIELAGQVNLAMPRYVVERLAAALDKRTGKGLKAARILILGAAYKKNVDDMRESPSLVLMEMLEARGAICNFHDPHIEVIPATRQHPHLSGRRSKPLSAGDLATYDAVLLSTDHDQVDYRLVAEHSNLVIDTRNVFSRLGLTNDKIVKA